MVRSEDQDECPDCEGEGVVTYYPGVYGTYDCAGPAEKFCETCKGSGLVDA